MLVGRFNLTEYLSHIGLSDYQPVPTLDCLKKIVFHHVITFPYQNRRLFQEGKKPVDQRQVASLDPDVIFTEIVKENGPAYCFQQLTLLYTVLAQAGFNISKRISKVILKPRADVNEDEMSEHPDTHIIMIVKINDQDYLVDPGFANESTREPLLLAPGIHELAGDTYLLENFTDHWTLHSRRYERNNQAYWYSLFQFNKQTPSEADIIKVHDALYKADNIGIRSNLLLFATVSSTKRKYVSWMASTNSGLFRSVNIDGSIRDEQKLCSENDVIEFACRKFSIKL